jgi:uncharacterized membrane protein
MNGRMRYYENRRRRHRSEGMSTAVVLGLGVAAAGALLGLALTKNGSLTEPDDDRTAKGLARKGRFAIAGRTVTINKPRSELYAFWRDFRHLPHFMENIEGVDIKDGDGRATWTIAAPMGRTVQLETEITEDVENRCIVWRTLPGSDLEARGRVEFRDAPADRGTEVEAVVAYDPPAGELGRWIAKAFQREPSVQGRRDLKRFKMLMETGEVATSKSRLSPLHKRQEM